MSVIYETTSVPTLCRRLDKLRDEHWQRTRGPQGALALCTPQGAPVNTGATLGSELRETLSGFRRRYLERQMAELEQELKDRGVAAP